MKSKTKKIIIAVLLVLILVASVFCNGEYGVDGFCFGCPVKIDKNGVKEIIAYKDLTEEENLKIKETMEFIKSLNNSIDNH